jgi:hypothetical protein
MFICMRTTFNLDDELFRALKKRAAETGRTMTELVDEALREMLARDPGPSEVHEFPWVTIRGKLRPGIDVTDRNSLLEAMEGRR